MIEILKNHSLGIILITITNLYIWSKILKRKPKIKSLKTCIIFILMAICTLINYLYINQFIRIVIITVAMTLFIKLLFNEKLNKAIICSVTAQLLYMIAEIIFVIILVYILRINPDNLAEIFFGKIITNTVIPLIVIILLQFKLVHRFYNLMIRITDKIKPNMLVIFLLIVMIAINIFFMTPYYSLNFTFIMVFNIILTIICFLITIYSLYNKNNYIKVYDKYNTTLNSLKEYEEILEKYRILNHENKNQFLTLRNMLSTDNKKVIKYIDTIVENKIKDNEKIMSETSKIPSGGLRGLIYSKLLVMSNQKINYKLSISNQVKITDLINNIDDTTLLDICKIIGVYLDNAIQEVTNIENKNINIEMYIIDEFLEIAISNNYKNPIEIDKLEEKGYTNKGKGHGYGLSLTKEIINNNKKLSNEKNISKEYFTQILKIELQKK